MIKREDIKSRMEQRPFTPFRIHTSSGRSHDVRHPETIYLMPNRVFLVVPSGQDPTSHMIDEYYVISILHITEIEPVGGPMGPSSDNGARVPA